MPKKPGDRTLMDSQHVKGSGTLLNLHGKTFVIIFHHSERELISRTLL